MQAEAPHGTLGRRCDMGCETWPDDDDYARCPQCGEPTTRYRDVHPLDADDARSKRLHIEFERFYAERCERRGVPVE